MDLLTWLGCAPSIYYALQRPMKASDMHHDFGTALTFRALVIVPIPALAAAPLPFRPQDGRGGEDVLADG